MNRECVPAVPKPRKRRATDSFEPKGIPLADLIDRASPRIDAYRPSPRTYAPESTNGDVRSPPSFDIVGKSFSRSFAQALGLDNRAADYLLHGIDHNYIRQCCNNFSYMASTFPFITVPTSDARTIATSRPLTTVAICTVASASQPEVQSRLSEACRQSLATKCIMEGERSIDLLAGLLIYVAWHHHYYKKQQIYQMLCLLAGMATDLGMQKTPSLSDQSYGVPDQEMQKAFIGVYYLTTALSAMGFNKPCPLSWSPSLDHFASTLYSNSREVNLQPYVDLAHILEDHARDVNAAPRVQAAPYIDLAVKSALSRLRTMQRMYPSAAGIPAVTACIVHITAGALTAADTTSGPGLMQAAIAIKEYLDGVLTRPSLSLHQIPVIDWTNLLETLILSTRLTSPAFLSSLSSSSVGWESSSLAAMLRPEIVLDAVTAHMAAAPADGRQGTRNEGLLSWLRSLCDSMKRRTAYDRNGHDESAFDTVSNLDRARRTSSAADDGRFRAVNASPSLNTPIGQRAAPMPWSPRGSDFTFSLFGGKGLLDESYWVAFGDY